MIKRDYYPIEQAAKLTNHTVEDLIHFGAAGKVPVYVLLDLCYPKIIFEHNADADTDKDFRIIDPQGSEKSMYTVPVSGPQRITAFSLKQFELGADHVAAGLDWNRAMGLSTSGVRRWYYPDPVVNLAVSNMVITEADVRLLKGEADDVPLLEEPSHRPLSTRERNGLYDIIDGLLKQAEIDIGEPYKAAEVLASLLSNEEGKPKVGAETIAKHLKNIRDRRRS